MKLTLSIRSGQVGGLKRGLEHTFDEAGGVIGRNAACDWQIEDATRTLSGRHATISFRNGHFYITDTSTNGVFVGGASEPLGRNRSAEITPGMRLNFGDYGVVATLQEDGRAADSRVAPRMSIAPEVSPRGLSTDPLDMLGTGTDHEALSLTERSRSTGFQPTPRRAGGGSRTGRDDTLGSFFGSTAPQRKDDPFADLGTSATTTSRGAGGGRVGTDWLGSDTAYDRVDSATHVPVQPPVAPELPVPPTRDLGSQLSDALASELDEPFQEPVRPSVRQIPRDATEITSYAKQTSPQPGPGGDEAGETALPHDLSWEDLLGSGGSSPTSSSREFIAPMSPAGSGQTAVPPLPPMEDLLGPSGASSPAPSVPPQPVARDQTTVPSARTTVPPEPGANAGRRSRRAPGNNLLSDLVTPATGAGAGLGSPPPAGGSLDPVSVLRERASHRAAVTQYAPEPFAPAPAPTTPAPAAPAASGESYDAVLAAAGIDPASVPEGDREAVACEIGRTARAASSGLVDVLAARRLFKEEFRLDRTRIQPEKNNPFKFYKTGEEALGKAAGGGESGFQSLSAGMKEGFTELKAHELASVTAMQEAIATVLAKLDPASIQAEDAAGGFFGRGDGKALWERYKDLHAGLAQDPEATSRKIVSEQFLRAYEKTLATLRAKDRP